METEDSKVQQSAQPQVGIPLRDQFLGNVIDLQVKVGKDAKQDMFICVSKDTVDLATQLLSTLKWGL